MNRIGQITHEPCPAAPIWPPKQALKVLGMGRGHILFRVMAGLDPAIHENIATSS
jgi:hypothetical protein